MDEAEEVVMIILDKLTKLMMASANNFRTIEIVTGRGSHSKGDAVLFPKISQYLKNQGYGVQASSCRGRLTCTVRFN